ncbi:hypothetical protein BaRGS_00037997 [Batillaria attramentaria]|uniref:Ribosomal protein n=1 Tax=Batillaria attramentaria TaxID=370345 RepID=A0ABD0J7Y2_9CAEN
MGCFSTTYNIGMPCIATTSLRKMASALRGVVGKVITAVCQTVAFIPTRPCIAKTVSPTSLLQHTRLLSTVRHLPSCITGLGKAPSPSSLPCAQSTVSLFSPTSSILSQVNKFTPVAFTQTRSYHVRLAVKRRCSGCYFVRRKGRLFVECKLKPRHKQMQMISKRKLWREDYSKGSIRTAVFWKYNEQRYYKLGDNEYARHDWLKGKIGVTV